MRRRMLALLFFSAVLAVATIALAEELWNESPVITKAYELSKGKVYLEWEGNAPVYQVYMDGKTVENTTVNNAVISVESGTHAIRIYPIREQKNADTKIGFNISVVSLDMDLAALGLDTKNLVAGVPSETLNIDYTPDTILDSVPEKPIGVTDGADRVNLSFSDRHNADEYVVKIKAGSDVNYVKFNCGSEDAAKWIAKENTRVNLVLDQQYLLQQGCIVPELDNKYTFSVQLRKYATDMLSGTSIKTVLHESKESVGCAYTPIALWKKEPMITAASQIADGQLYLSWSHSNNHVDCEYVLVKINKTLGIQTGEERMYASKEKELVLTDLLSGEHTFAVVPVYNGEQGNQSEPITIEIQNAWEIKPDLVCKQIGENTIKLAWTSLEGIELYRVTVYAGDSGSLLRFVDMDFEKHDEFEVASSAGSIEYEYVYAGEANGVKLKFEMVGVHLTETGIEQKTPASEQTITLD